jgi:hypothetical protein
MDRKSLAMLSAAALAVALSGSPFVQSAAAEPVPTVTAETSAPPAPPASDAQGNAAQGSAAPARQAPRRYHQATLDERVTAMAKALALDAAQRTQVKRILEGQRQQVFALLHDPLLPPEGRSGALRAANDRTVEQIRALLTDEQRQKYYPSGPRATPGTSADSVSNLQYWLNAGSTESKRIAQ